MVSDNDVVRSAMPSAAARMVTGYVPGAALPVLTVATVTLPVVEVGASDTAAPDGTPDVEKVTGPAKFVRATVTVAADVVP